MKHASRIRTLVAVAIFLSLAGNVAVAQSRTAGPAQGDIIRYEHVTFGTTYALVLGSDGRTLNVEKIEDDGDIRSTNVPFAFAKNIEIIESLKSNKKAQPRTWKSKDGKFEILATLVGVKIENARLKKENGKIISVPLNKLSQKDQAIILKGDTASDPENPFAGEESDDHPQPVQLLIERRASLMKDQERHQRLTKGNPNLQMGDIIKYESFSRGQTFGVVTGLGRRITVESIDRKGDLDPDMAFTSRTSWFLVDRAETPLMTRTWSSSSGEFKIEAKLAGLENGELSLLKPDGSTLNVPLEKLGNADKKYVAKNKSKLSSSDDESLQVARETYDDNMQRLLERRGQVVELASANRVAAVDASNMSNIALNTKPIKLPTERLIPLDYRSQSVSLNCTIDAGKMARADAVCYSESAGLIAFVAASPFGGQATLALVNASTGEVITNSENDPIEGRDASVLAISPSGKTVLIVSSKSMRDQQLEYWKHENEQLERVGVVSYGSMGSPRAHLFDDQLGIVLNKDGDMVFVEMSDRIKPTHIIRSGERFSGSQIQVSNDQKSVFYFGSGGSSLHIIDVESRKCVGGIQLGQPDRMFTAAQVTPDGTEVFQIQKQQVCRYDLISGEQISQQTLPKNKIATSRHGGFPYLGPNLVRLFDRSIFDLKLGVKIGQVESRNFGQRFLSNSTSITIKSDRMSRSGSGGFGGSLFGGSQQSGENGRRDDSDTRTPKNFSVSLQHLDLGAIAEFSDTLTDADVVEFGEGDSLQLKFNVGDPSVETQLRNKIGVVMAAGGVDVVENSDFVLSLAYSVGKSRTETFNIIGGMTPRKRTVTFTPKTCSAVLTYKGEKLWSTGQSAGSGRPYSEEDLDQSLNASKSITARTLLSFTYPNQLREIPPSKRKNFSWQ